LNTASFAAFAGASITSRLYISVGLICFFVCIFLFVVFIETYLPNIK
jgi:hypothetical protein